MAVSMLPGPALLPDVLPTERLTAKGLARPPVRAALRRIPNLRNAVTVVAALAQTFGVVTAAGLIATWWSYLAAFVVMGRGHCQLNILGHEAAHRLLFSSRRLNDFCGRWLLSYPAIAGMLAYRRVHMAHHRDEMGPEEPDVGLYRGYPVPPDSLRRKLVRDLFFVSGYKNLRGLAHAARRKGEARQVVAVQLTLFGLGAAAGMPLPTWSASGPWPG
jgi:fatty acid desaturase